MKPINEKPMSNRIIRWLGVVALLSSFFIWESCKDDTTFEPLDPIGRTYVHFFNAYPGLEAVDVRFETGDQKRTVGEGIYFNNSWPNNGYASLLTPTDTVNGTGGVRISILDHLTRQEIVPPTFMKVTEDDRSTFVLVDSFDKPIFVKTLDVFDEQSDTTALVRLMNINRFVLAASLVTKTNDITIRNLNFLNYSNALPMPAGTYSFYFVNDVSGQILDSIPNLEIKRRGIYSFFLTQKDGQPVGGYRWLE